MALLRKILPASRLWMAVWAWRHRAWLMDWAAFAVRALQAAVSGEGTSDARAELRLRANLARSRKTRGLLLDVRVERGVAILRGRVTPEEHARIQDITVATGGIERVDDQLSHALAAA